MTLLMFPAPALDTEEPAVDLPASPEERVSDVFTDYVEVGSPGPGYFFRRPGRALDLLRDLRRLPVLDAHPSGDRSGANLRASIPRSTGPGRFFGHRSVLELPDTLAAYVDGRSKQTLRRKVRQAQKQGVSWKLVDTPAERRRLLTAAALWERQVGADADVADLDDYDLWLAAYGVRGEPLLLAVTPVDGEWAVLRYYRTIGTGTAQSNARYLMMQVLAEQLIERRVRYLVDAIAPATLSNGLRHFQRMLGFRIFRIRSH